ncbi:MAG: type IV pilin N-terminal domain-containing protein [Methanomicrobiales archaeon]
MTRVVRKGDTAVSPVIGVMLMLVVTVIIAAVVSAFAGGMAGDTQMAPQASFGGDVDLSQNATIFEHRGGDAIDLDEIGVVFEQEDSKITLTRRDVGTNCVAFEKVGDTGTLIATGDRFTVEGTECSWTTGITYGGMSLIDNKRFTWSIIDRESGTVIATGSSIIE